MTYPRLLLDAKLIPQFFPDPCLAPAAFAEVKFDSRTSASSLNTRDSVEGWLAQARDNVILEYIYHYIERLKISARMMDIYPVFAQEAFKQGWNPLFLTSQKTKKNFKNQLTY